MQVLNWSLPLELNGRGISGTPELIEVNGEEASVRVTDRGGYVDIYSFNTMTGVYVGHEGRDDQARIRNQSKEIANQYFRIWFGHESWAKESWRYLGNDSEFQFTDPKQAQAKAKALNAEAKSAGSPARFMTKPHTEMSPDHKWRSWMLARFESGEYPKLPWHDEEWVIKDHFAHCSLADPFRVAYVQNESHGVLDRITTISAGTYLTQFYSDKLSAQEISQWTIKLDSEAELKFATTSDEIEHVYTTSGISSCMSYKASHFPTKIHPCRVYGAGDLELAYLERRGKIIARALVRRSNMTVQRVYGDNERLMTRLVAEGFTDGQNSPDTFIGARILNIKVGEETVMPYLDWELHAKDNPDDPNTLLLCSRAECQYSGKSTNGIASGRTIHTCGRDGCETTFVADTPGILYAHARGRSFCDSCSTEHLRTCQSCGVNFEFEANNSRSGLPIMNAEGHPSLYRGNPGFICSTCIIAEAYTVYENAAYSSRNTLLHQGVRLPRHVVAQLQEA